MQVQNFRLASQQVVTNTQPLHGVENLLDVSRRDVIGQLGSRIIAFLDGVQNLGSQFHSLRICFTTASTFAIERSDSRVEIPAVVIKRAVGGKGMVYRLDVVERHVFDMHKADDDISYLHAGVVYVVLDFDAVPAGAQYVHKRVAQN